MTGPKGRPGKRGLKGSRVSMCQLKKATRMITLPGSRWTAEIVADP